MVAQARVNAAQDTDIHLEENKACVECRSPSHFPAPMSGVVASATMLGVVQITMSCLR
jgi:hypothetical protein